MDLLNYSNNGYVFVNATFSAPYNNRGYNWTTINITGAPGGRQQDVVCGVPYGIYAGSNCTGAPSGQPFQYSYVITDIDGLLARGYYSFGDGPIKWRSTDPLFVTPSPNFFNGTSSPTPGQGLETIVLYTPPYQWLNISEGGVNELNPYLTPWGAFYLGPRNYRAGWSKDWFNIDLDVILPPNSCKISVVLGWNLISIPLRLGNQNLPSALNDNNGDTQWDRILWYNSKATVDKWKQFNKNWNSVLNDLRTVNNTMGLWVNITIVGDGYLNISGYNPTSMTITLKAGWNLVGYPSLCTNMTVSDAFLGTSVDIVEVFDSYRVYKTRVMEPSEVMKPGNGYWVHSTVDCVWAVNW